jgi:hypothetical protein
MPSLHDELVGDSKRGACKVCSFLATLSEPERAEWEREIALPTTTISHAAIVVALKRRRVSIEEASVRRHRSNHVGLR